MLNFGVLFMNIVNIERTQEPQTSSINEPKREVLANATDRLIVDLFQSMAFGFTVVGCVAGAAGIVCSVVPGADLAAVPLFVAAAVCSAVGLLFHIISRVIESYVSPLSPPTEVLSEDDEVISFEGKIWYEEVLNKIDGYKNISNITRQMEIDYIEKVKQSYQWLILKHPTLDLMGGNYALSGNIFCLSFKMQGLALIASYLKDKHQLEHLYVCDSLEAFQSQLLQLSQSEEDLKAALVISTRGLSKYNTWVPENQHKATVCIEKVNGKLKIFHLDSQPFDVDENLLKENASELKEIREMSSFAVFWAIYHSGIDVENAEFYRYTKTREHAGYGCETFALKDAVAFLKTDNFLERVKLGTTSDESIIQLITELPPQFMKTTQSLTQLEKYENENPELANEEIPKSPGSEKVSMTLHDVIQKYTRKGYDKNMQLVDQNHYTSIFSLKYHLMVLKAMQMMSTAQLEEVIAETFVAVERPSLKTGEEPQNIHQLYEYWAQQSAQVSLWSTIKRWLC